MSETTKSSGYILTLLMTLGLLSCAVILVTVIWLSDRINLADQKRAADLINLMLNENAQTLENSVADYSHWETAYDIIKERDDDAAYDDMGSSAAETDVFDQLYIFSGTGELIYAFGADLLPEQAASEAFDQFMTMVSEPPLKDLVTISGMMQFDGVTAQVSAARVLPNDPESIDQSDAPIMIGTLLLGEARLSLFQTRVQVDDISIRQNAPEAGNGYIALRGPQGAKVGYLVWPEPRSGTTLLKGVLPGILITCVAIFALCLSAARYFQQQSNQFVQATQLARTDALTGLRNRAGLSALMQETRFKEALAAGHLAVLYIDLNKFKHLNDTYGHEAGDAALETLGTWLERSMRRTDYAVRLGGDEFICIVLDPAPSHTARHVAERLTSCMEQCINVNGQRIALRASIGIAVAEPGANWDALLKQSDLAMYAAKSESSTNLYPMASA